MSRHPALMRSFARGLCGLAAAACVLAVAACDGSDTTATSPAQANPWNAPVGPPVLGATLSDGWYDLREAPGPVNVTGGWTDSVAVTPDGKHLYFAYTQVNFADFLADGTINVSGPLRTGMSDPWFHIFRADLATDGWRIHYHPLNAPQNGGTLFGQASASANAAGDLIVYSQFDDTGRAKLMYSTLAGGEWAAPVDLSAASALDINVGCTGGADNGFVIGSLGAEVTLAWESHVDYGAAACDANHHLYWTTYTAGTGVWAPIALIPGLNDMVGGSDDSQLSFTPDGQTAFWTSSASRTYGIYTADWDGSTFGNVRLIVQPTPTPPITGQLVFVGEANVALLPEGRLLYMMCGIANSPTTNLSGVPVDVTLKVCVARKDAT